MAKVLTVIFGAGASFDCRSEYQMRNVTYPRLPLTNGLFIVPEDNSALSHQANEILSRYKGASFFGQLYLREARYRKGLSFENFLKEELKKCSQDALRNIREIPFCLRELVGHYSSKVTAKFHHTDYTNLLYYLENKSDFDKVVLITLNYDDLLDSAIETVSHLRLDILDEFISPKSKWCYVKLHGSINWVKRLKKKAIKELYPEHEEKNALTLIDPESPLVGNADIAPSRGNYTIGSNESEEYLYPVMVLPFGQDKKHICPAKHFNSMVPLVQESQELWVVGNSMQDSDVRDILKENGKSIKKIIVVDKFDNDKSKEELAIRIDEAFGRVVPRRDLNDGFHKFVEGLR